MSMLEARGIDAGYGDLQILRSVDLSVDPGELVAVLGRNGAGKTTLLRALSGLNPLGAGEVLFEGVSVGRHPPYVRARRGLGYVQDNKRIFTELSVDANLRLGGYAARLSGRELAAEIGRAHERFPILAEKSGSLARSLSGGQQQMLGISQALCGRPKLLMLDEPSTGLAPAIVQQILQIVAGLRSEGMGVLLVEQSVDVALSVADRVVVLDAGRVVLESDVHATGLRDTIEKLYMGARLEVTPDDGVDRS